MPETIGENLAAVRERIEKACEASGRSPSEVDVMAVTKTHPVETVRAAVAAGIRVIGENRVTEGGRKARELGADFAEFHLIGPVHTREVRQAVRDFRWIDSVDRTEIAVEMIRRRAANPLLAEVNTSGEPGKKGFPPDHDALTEALGMMARSGLRVEGLMTVGPLSVSEKDSRRAFALLRELRDRLRVSLGLPLDILSMGMSDDYVHAVREGSTMVRLGRVLLGERR